MEGTLASPAQPASWWRENRPTPRATQASLPLSTQPPPLREMPPLVKLVRIGEGKTQRALDPPGRE
ncbi:MAG TPA: hypothetical protein VK140_11450 [Ktedonobacteraceae bacterium]|nr:hypothetical protein [Ktedonobacteraceae bacterium]